MFTRRHHNDIRHLPELLLRDIGLSEREIQSIRASRHVGLVLLPDGRSIRL